MKRQLLFLTLGAIVAGVSCTTEPKKDPQNPLPEGIYEVAINSASTSLSYTDFLTLPEHNDFLTADLQVMIASSPRHSQAIRYSTQQQAPKGETITLSPEQIPIVHTKKHLLIVRADRSYRMEVINFIDPELNAFNDLSEEPMVDMTKVASKLIIENGILKAYNHLGVLLDEYPDDSFSSDEFQMLMQEYYDAMAAQDSITTRTGEVFKRDINWLQQKMASSENGKKVKIEQLGNGYIAVTMPFDLPNTMEVAMLTRAGGEAVVRTVMSDDLSRIYIQEVKHGEQLLSRQQNYYAKKENISKYVVKTSEGVELATLPAYTISEKLTLADDGTPMVKTIKESYSHNSISITNKK